jgi:hypothetical protein
VNTYTEPDQLFVDSEYNMSAHVFRKNNGCWCVRLIDNDSDNVVGVRIFTDKLRAIAYARGLVNTTSE